MQISFVLLFTDGQGIAPVEVNQRVLWVLTNGGSKPAAYGESVQFE
jgi:predicted metal-dependent peptidase